MHNLSISLFELPTESGIGPKSGGFHRGKDVQTLDVDREIKMAETTRILTGVKRWISESHKRCLLWKQIDLGTHNILE